MSKARAPRLDMAHVRQRAEERLAQRKETVRARSGGADVARLLHELEVHQIELEMQNEELREARLDLEASLQRYTEIFDFAPIPYTSIGVSGHIREINHAGARLLGRVRSNLLGQDFASLVPARHAAGFQELLQRVIASDCRETCELQILARDGRLLDVRLLATLLARVEPTILLAIESASQYAAHAPRVSGLQSR